MKQRVILLVSVSIFGLLLAVLTSQSSNAQTAGAVDSTVVSQQCGLAQDYFDATLKPRDLRARVDRLQAYRYIFQRLDIYVGRLERNNQPGAAELRTHLNEFSKQTEAFKNSYETYDSTRELAATYKNCSSDPETFLKRVNAARVERQNVHTSVESLDILLNQTIKNQLELLHQDQLLENKTEGGNRE